MFVSPMRVSFRTVRRSVVLGTMVVAIILGTGYRSASAGGSATPPPIIEVRSGTDASRALNTLPPTALLRAGGTVISVQDARNQLAQSRNALIKDITSLPFASTAWSKRPLSDFHVNASAGRPVAKETMTATMVAPVSGASGNVTQYGAAPQITYLPPVQPENGDPGWIFEAALGSQSSAARAALMQKYCPGATLCLLTDPQFKPVRSKAGTPFGGLHCGENNPFWYDEFCYISLVGGSHKGYFTANPGQKFVGLEEVGCDPGKFHVRLDVWNDKPGYTNMFVEIQGTNDNLGLCRVRVAIATG